MGIIRLKSLLEAPEGAPIPFTKPNVEFPRPQQKKSFGPIPKEGEPLKMSDKNLNADLMKILLRYQQQKEDSVSKLNSWLSSNKNKNKEEYNNLRNAIQKSVGNLWEAGFFSDLKTQIGKARTQVSREFGNISLNSYATTLSNEWKQAAKEIGQLYKIAEQDPAKIVQTLQSGNIQGITQVDRNAIQKFFSQYSQLIDKLNKTIRPEKSLSAQTARSLTGTPSVPPESVVPQIQKAITTFVDDFEKTRKLLLPNDPEAEFLKHPINLNTKYTGPVTEVDDPFSGMFPKEEMSIQTKSKYYNRIRIGFLHLMNTIINLSGLNLDKSDVQKMMTDLYKALETGNVPNIPKEYSPKLAKILVNIASYVKNYSRWYASLFHQIQQLQHPERQQDPNAAPTT